MSAAWFTSGTTMQDLVVMAATCSAGLALFLGDATNLFQISLLGGTELAAPIGLAAATQFFIVSVSLYLLNAGSASVSCHVGAGRRDEARRLAGLALGVAALLLAGVAVVAWALRRETAPLFVLSYVLIAAAVLQPIAAGLWAGRGQCGDRRRRYFGAGAFVFTGALFVSNAASTT